MDWWSAGLWGLLGAGLLEVFDAARELKAHGRSLSAASNAATTVATIAEPPDGRIETAAPMSPAKYLRDPAYLSAIALRVGGAASLAAAFNHFDVVCSAAGAFAIGAVAPAVALDRLLATIVPMREA